MTGPAPVDESSVAATAEAPGSSPRRRARRAARGSVRVRTTALAVLVVGLALLVGAAVLLVAVRRAAVDRVESNAELRAADVVTALDAGVEADDLALDEGEDRFIQIVGPDGEVLAASRTIIDAPPLTGNAGAVVTLPVGDDDDRWVVVEGEVASGPTVVVGREIDKATETVGPVAGVLAVGIPLLLLVVGATTWFVTGRALAPVDAIREEADAIGASELHRRVPVPAGDDEIARLAVTVNGMLARLEASHRRQRRFVADAAHELRSPVATIRQHAEVALTTADPGGSVVPAAGQAGGDDEVLAAVVLAESERLGALVDDLILLARADEGALSGGGSPVDLDDLVLAEAARLPAALSVDLSAVSAGRVLGDRRQLERVVRNIAVNAATHAGGRVAFGLGAPDGVVTLTVDDDGGGVPVDDRERVFERFVRLDEARSRDHGGSGLGLAIADEVVRAHGGEISVDAGPLGGARFTVRLPAAE